MTTKVRALVQAALAYHNLGLNALPLANPEKTATKHPSIPWKDKSKGGIENYTYKDYTQERFTRADIQAHESWYSHGVVAITGIEHKHAIDIDKIVDFSIVDTILSLLGLPPDYPWVVLSGSRKGAQIWTHNDERAGDLLKGFYAYDAQDKNLFDHVELRWSGNCCVLPPSKHPSGNYYAFRSGKFPTSPPTTVPLERIQKALETVGKIRNPDKEQGNQGQPDLQGNDAYERVKSRFAVIDDNGDDAEVTCLWQDEHSDGRVNAHIWRNNDGTYGYSCLHAHCKERRWRDVLKKLGLDSNGKPIPAYIGHPDIDRALYEKSTRDLYQCSEIIALFDRERLAKLKVIIRHIFKQELPLREFNEWIDAQRERLLDDQRRRNMPVPLPADEFMKIQREPAKPVIPGLFYEGLYGLAGKGKIGKSQLALDVGLPLTYGGVALGKIKIDQPGEMLYIDLEDTEINLEDRINLKMAQFAPRTPVPTRLYLVTQWPRLDAIGVETLENFIKSHPALRMVVIDPWVKIKPRIKQRAGETLYDADYDSLEEVKRLANTYHLCILIYFHITKEGRDDPLDEVNASSGAPACADGFYILKRGRGETDGTLWGTGRTMKQDVNIALSFRDGTWTILGDAATHALSKERKAIVDEVKANPKGMTAKQVAVALGKPYSTINITLRRMENDGEIRRQDTLYFDLGSATHTPTDPSTTNNNFNESSSYGSYGSYGSHDSYSSYNYEGYAVTTEEKGPVVTDNPPVERANGHGNYDNYDNYQIMQKTKNGEAAQNGHQRDEMPPPIKLPHCQNLQCLTGPNRTDYRMQNWGASRFYCRNHRGYIDENGRPV